MDDSEGIKALLKSETLKCDGRLLGLLMADHTQLDWRALLPKIKSPCLNFVGKKSKIFPWEGVAYVGKYVPLCENYIYANAGHWLYIEEPFQFAMDGGYMRLPRRREGPRTDSNKSAPLHLEGLGGAAGPGRHGGGHVGRVRLGAGRGRRRGGGAGARGGGGGGARQEKEAGHVVTPRGAPPANFDF